MDKAHPLSLPMVVRSLDLKNDPFCSCEKDEELLCFEVPYLSEIGALMYLLIVFAQILIFLSIYYLGIVPLKPKDIGMISNIYYATSKEQLI